MHLYACVTDTILTVPLTFCMPQNYYFWLNFINIVGHSFIPMQGFMRLNYAYRLLWYPQIQRLLSWHEQQS